MKTNLRPRLGMVLLGLGGSPLITGCPPTPCSDGVARATGDVLFTDKGAEMVFGFRPQSHEFYVHSKRTSIPGATENGDIVSVPDAPREQVVIGNFDEFHIGVARIDSCGELVGPSAQPTSSVWGTFRQFTSTVFGIFPRGLAFSPLTGALWMPGRTEPDSVLYTVGPGGGEVTEVSVAGDRRGSQMYGAIAFDSDGRLYEGDADGRLSVTNVESLSAAQAVELPVSGATLSSIVDLLVTAGHVVGRANRQLLVTANTREEGRLYGVDLQTLVVEELLAFPRVELNRLTIDEDEQLWFTVMETESDGQVRPGVMRVVWNGTGWEHQSFLVPLVDGIPAVPDSTGAPVPVYSPTGISVYGEAIAVSAGRD